MYTSDEKLLVNHLHPAHRLIFAATCASRLFGLYLTFYTFTKLGDPEKLRSALDSVWNYAKGQENKPCYYEQRLEEVMRLIPTDDEVWTGFHAGAEDAVTAVAYALRTLLTEDPQEAAWAARCVYESLDHHFITRRRIDVNRPGSNAELINDPAMQAELTRQDRHLRELEESSSNVDDLAERFRLRAESEQAIEAR